MVAREPFYAVVGAGDLVIEKIRLRKLALETIPDRLHARTAEAVDNAGGVYEDLVSRGSRLVTRIRNQESTQKLERQAENTVNRAKGAATATKRTATTAKRSATTAGSRAKATATAAKRTAAQAKEAATDAADKVGD